MKQSLTELVGVILARLQDTPEGKPSEAGLRTWLAGQGYAKRDIDAAMNLVGPRFYGDARVQEATPGQVRHLSDYERLKMSPEARNALTRLEMFELLDPMEREMILERLDHFEGEVGMEELDYLVSWVACSSKDAGHQQTVYNVLEGKDITLH